MKIETAKLIGVLSPTRQRTGFKIPLFSAPRKSNSYLVQILDSSGRIAMFAPFATDEPIEGTGGLHIEFSIGSEPCWCFGLSETDNVFGLQKEIEEHFVKNEWIISSLPYVAMQIVDAFQMRDYASAVKQEVYRRIAKDANVGTAVAWLDVEVLTPSLRAAILQELPRTTEKNLIGGYFSEVFASTNQLVDLYIPDWLMSMLKNRKMWELKIVDAVQSAASDYNLEVSRKISITESEINRTYILSKGNVNNLKLEAVSALSKTNDVQVHQVSRSYFQNQRENYRVVCTFSSRYQGVGKRRYWFGFHKIWEDWMSEAVEAYLVLGCFGRRIAFAIPLQKVQACLRFLRATGEGQNKFWHLDVISYDGREDYLDLGRNRTPLDLRDFIISY